MVSGVETPDRIDFEDGFGIRPDAEEDARSPHNEYIDDEELSRIGGEYIEITKMLTRWINYLQRCNWRQRGQPPDTNSDD
jgi:hypothetical protein